MNNFLWFGKRILCLKFNTACENLNKCLHNVASNTRNKKEWPLITPENQYDILSEILTPWWQLDYGEQLLRKKQRTKLFVGTFKSNKVTRCKTKIHEIIPSPKIESYRNKDEFSIRTGIDGNDKTVGFFVGSPAEGNVTCVKPTKLISLKENHILLAEAFQELICESPLKASHDLNDGGYWRNLIVRSNRKGEIMLVVLVNPLGASGTALEESKELLKDRLLSTGINITSLYHQACPHVRCTTGDAPYDLLHGDKYLYETIDNIKVRVSPDSFLHTNIEAYDTLYTAALSLAKLSDKTTILDLYSGIGSFSLIAARHVRGCAGIEILNSAVSDANFNAKCNDLTNCHFVTGGVEKELKGVIKDLDLASDLVTILNPGGPRVGKNIINILRKTFKIRTVIYISHNPEGITTMKDFYNLCSPSFDKSNPFYLTDVQTVDTLPLTSHCEMIFVFNR